MEERTTNATITKPGGTASKNAACYRVTIPNNWAKQLEITKESRLLKITLTDDNKIIIEKL